VPGDRFLDLVAASDRRVLDTLFRHAREGVTVQGRDGLIYANDRAAEILGLETGEEMVATPVAELLGRFDVVDENGKPFDWDRLPGRLVLAGEQPEEVTMGYRFRGSRRVRWSRVNASPIKGDTGEVVWALNFFLDITDQFALRDRERIAAQVSEALSGSLRMAPNLAALTDIIVPEIASWCGFHILDEFDDLIPDAVAFPHSAEAQSLFDLVNIGPISRDADQMQARVLATGKPEYIPRITDEMLQAAEETRGKEFTDVLRRLEWRSVLCVPLGDGLDPVGSMTLVRTRSDGGFDPSELALVNEIAQRAGVALANAQAFEREHHTAEALRRGLRPESLPSLQGLTAAARYRPVSKRGHVGGDFYDLIKIDEDRGVAVVGDIEGKGVEAAAAVGLVRQALKTTIALDPDPTVVFKQLNDSLLSDAHSRMCTVAYLQLDRQENGFSGLVSLAGHPPPVILRSDGSVEPIGEPSPPAGVFPELAPSPQKFELGPGDVLLVYTDGLAVADMTSAETVTRLVVELDSTDPDALVGTLLDRFLEEVPSPRDDVALLALRVAV
jgi:Stage II sporulation protein E (SpoIIE)/GAF domain/PAS domain